MITITNRPCT